MYRLNIMLFPLKFSDHDLIVLIIARQVRKQDFLAERKSGTKIIPQFSDSHKHSKMIATWQRQILSINETYQKILNNFQWVLLF